MAAPSLRLAQRTAANNDGDLRQDSWWLSDVVLAGCLEEQRRQRRHKGKREPRVLLWFDFEERGEG
jgi:hypothetical protein